MGPIASRRRQAKRPQRFDLEALRLDETAAEPLYRQLEARLKEAILAGRLQPGERLPSTRRLARDLAVARNTTINAYNQLIVEGYLVTQAGSGTRVALDLPEHLLQVAGRAQATKRPAQAPHIAAAVAERLVAVNDWIKDEVDRPARPFRAHTPASDAFPRALWAQLMTRRLREMSRHWLERGDPRGYRPLREAIAGYLGSARGVTCEPDQVIVTAGAQQAVEILAKLLIEPGDRVCMEDPGYRPAGVTFELAGAEVVPIPVDEEGIDVAALHEKAPKAKLVYVTASSQFPLGMTLSLPRRLALLEWAEQAGALVLEDDYSGEYRYAGRPLPALHGLAPPGRVLYTGSFSKLLFPSLRIGYVVAPPEIVGHLAAARWLIDRHSPPLEQAVLADFIDQGHFARHVRRMRTLYAERQAALVEAAAKELAGIMTVPAQSAGLHLIGWLAPQTAEAKLLAAASAVGIELMPVSWFSIEPRERAGVILGYAPFAAREIRLGAKALKRAHEQGRGTPR